MKPSLARVLGLSILLTATAIVSVSAANIMVTQKMINPANGVAAPGASVRACAVLSMAAGQQSIVSGRAQVDMNGAIISAPLSFARTGPSTSRVCTAFTVPKNATAPNVAIKVDLQAANPSEVQTGLVIGYLTLKTPFGTTPPHGSTPVEAIKPVTPLTLPMRLTLNDEFKNGLDTSTIWTNAMNVANPGGEQQKYMQDEVQAIPGGGVRLTANRRQIGNKPFTAGAFTSMMGFSQRYGHFEMKAKLPKGIGTWSAFWLLPIDQSWPPEIDIIEHLGRQPMQANVGYYWPEKKLDGSFKKAQDGGHMVSKVDLTQDYHVYAVDWRPDAIVFSLDGIEILRRTKNIPDKPMYMLANLALGGSWAHNVPNNLQFPLNMDIAYIRVFQYDDMPAEQIQPMQFGKLNLSKNKLALNEKLGTTGSILIGNEAREGVTVHTSVKAIDTGTTYNSAYARLGNIPANTTRPFTTEIDLKGLPAGVYKIKVLATSTRNGKFHSQIYYGAADQIIVGEPDLRTVK